MAEYSSQTASTNSRIAANTVISHAFGCGFYLFLQGLRNRRTGDPSG